VGGRAGRGRVHGVRGEPLQASRYRERHGVSGAKSDRGLLILRTGLGGVLVAHGVQKLFGWLGGAGLEDTAAAFEQMGFVPGRQSALAAALGEAGAAFSSRSAWPP
jgi:uncharacterized membrane protein YphA (DoxX/SURF4 family)